MKVKAIETMFQEVERIKSKPKSIIINNNQFLFPVISQEKIEKKRSNKSAASPVGYAGSKDIFKELS